MFATAIFTRLQYLDNKQITKENVPSLLPQVGPRKKYPKISRVLQGADDLDCVPATIACLTGSTLIEVLEAVKNDAIGGADKFAYDKGMRLIDMVQEPELGRRYLALVVGGNEEKPGHATVLDYDGTFVDPSPFLADRIPFDIYPLPFIVFAEVDYV